MFYTDEDVQPAVNLAEKLFGKSNQYKYENYEVGYSNTMPLTIMTREFGKLWTGEVFYDEEFKNKLELLSATINQRIYLTNDYDYEQAYYVTTSKLREIPIEDTYIQR